MHCKEAALGTWAWLTRGDIIIIVIIIVMCDEVDDNHFMHARLPDPSTEDQYSAYRWKLEEGGGGRGEGEERGFVDRTEKVHGHAHVGYDYRSRLVLPRLLIKYTSFWGES